MTTCGSRCTRAEREYRTEVLFWLVVVALALPISALLLLQLLVSPRPARPALRPSSPPGTAGIVADRALSSRSSCPAHAVGAANQC
jgi:hypothetical protein